MGHDGSDASFKAFEASLQALYQPFDIAGGERAQEGIVSHLRRVVDLTTGAHVCRFGRTSTRLSNSLRTRIYRLRPQQ